MKDLYNMKYEKRPKIRDKFDGMYLILTCTFWQQNFNKQYNNKVFH